MTVADIPLEGDVSSSEAELNAKIDAELGIVTPPPTANTEEEKETTDATTTTEEDNSDTTVADDSDSQEEAEDESTDTTTEEVAAPPAVTPPAEPSDEELFIEVEDAEGVTHKISTIDDLPEDFTPKNNRQILEIIRATDKLDRQRASNEEKATAAAAEAELTAARQDQFNAWDNEVNELAKGKRIDVANTDRIDAVFAHMNEINAARTKAGNPNLVTSFEDALDKFEAKEAKDKAEADKKNDNERAKAKASLIGRSSAVAGDSYVYRAGSARSIDDVPLG